MGAGERRLRHLENHGILKADFFLASSCCCHSVSVSGFVWRAKTVCKAALASGGGCAAQALMVVFDAMGSHQRMTAWHDSALDHNMSSLAKLREAKRACHARIRQARPSQLAQIPSQTPWPYLCILLKWIAHAILARSSNG
jgi:hypothetical protein